MLSTKIHLSPSKLWLLIGTEFVSFVIQNPELLNKVLGLKALSTTTQTTSVPKPVKEWLKCDFSCSAPKHMELAKKNTRRLTEPPNPSPSQPHIKGRLSSPTIDPQYVYTEGTLEDWKHLSKKIGKLLVYSYHNSLLLKWYSSLFRVINCIQEFHKTGKIKQDFWQSMFQVSTNPTTWEIEISGWGTLFSSIQKKTIPLQECATFTFFSDFDFGFNPYKPIVSPIEEAFQRDKSANDDVNLYEPKHDSSKTEDNQDEEFCIL